MAKPNIYQDCLDADLIGGAENWERRIAVFPAWLVDQPLPVLLFPRLAHQLFVSEAGDCLSEPVQVVASDRNAHGAGILGEAAANVLNARQPQLGRARIEACQNVIWHVADQYVTHTHMMRRRTIHHPPGRRGGDPTNDQLLTRGVTETVVLDT